MLKRILTAAGAILGLAANLAAETPWLRFDVAPGMGIGVIYSEVNGARFRVDIAPEDGDFQTVWSMVYGGLNQWYPMALDLSHYAGQTVRLRLISEHIENRICQDYPFWGDPRIGTGNLKTGEEATVADRLALRPPDRMGQLLPDGGEIEFTEPAQFFGYQGVELVTPGMCSTEHHGMVYGGASYITVTGKSQPGLYIGFDMSHGFGGGVTEDRELIARFRETYRGDAPFHENLGVDVMFPYTGPDVAPVFAEWRVEVPAGTPPLPTPEAQTAELPESEGAPPPLSTRRDVYRFQPGWDAAFDPADFTWRANSGDKPAPGWAFAAVESLGNRQLELELSIAGELTAAGENAFAGVVVDYHTPYGYRKRVWLALAPEFARPRDDVRPGGWILDEAAFSLLQRLNFQQESHLIAPGELRLALAEYAPPDWDGRFWLALGLQNVSPGVQLAMRLAEIEALPANPRPASAEEAAAAVADFEILRGDRTVLAVSRLNGALCGAWDAETGEAWLGEAADGYKLESRYSISEAEELLDRVTATEWRRDGRELSVRCVNPALPGLIIAKSYRFGDDGRWYKRVAVTLQEGEGCFFTWTSRAGLAGELNRSGRRGAGFGTASRVAQGRVIEESAEAPPAEQAGQQRPAMVTKADHSSGIGSYRTRVNDRFVLAGLSGYRPDGWELFGFCDYLAQGETVSGEVAFERYDGDFADLLLSYQSQPEFRELYDLAPVEWMKMLVCDSMYTEPRMLGIGRALVPFATSSCIWFLGYPWGNYGADHFDPCRNGKHPDVWNIAVDYRESMPQHRMSAYHNFLFDEASDLFRERPWMGVRDREGSLVGSGISSDTTRGTSFLMQAANPEVRRIMSEMYAGQVRHWNFDYLYFDGPGFGVETPDWGSLDVAQSYDWIELMRDSYRAIKRVSDDQVIFCNGILPYSQLGYIEYRDAQWLDLTGPEWHTLAAELWQQKLTEPDGFLRVPTYGHMSAEPGLSAYLIFYGWLGNLSDVRRAPWMLAAHELHYGRLRRGAVTPDWLRQGGDTEVCAFTADKLGWLTLLNHGKPEPVTLTLKTAELGLEPGRKLYGWRWEMELPDPDRSGIPPEAPLETLRAEAMRPVMHPAALPLPEITPETLELTLQAAPLATNVIFLSHAPVLIQSVDGVPRQMGLRHPSVDLENRDADGCLTVTAVNRAAEAVLLLPGIGADRVTVRTPRHHQLRDGDSGALLTLGRGRYEFEIR